MLRERLKILLLSPYHQVTSFFFIFLAGDDQNLRHLPFLVSFGIFDMLVVVRERLFVNLKLEPIDIKRFLTMFTCGFNNHTIGSESVASYFRFHQLLQNKTEKNGWNFCQVPFILTVYLPHWRVITKMETWEGFPRHIYRLPRINEFLFESIG